jgi:hypothetical protein
LRTKLYRGSYLAVPGGSRLSQTQGRNLRNLRILILLCPLCLCSEYKICGLAGD